MGRNVFEPRFVTQTKLAEIVGCSRQTIYRMIKLERIKAIKFGSTYRIPIEEAKKIIKQGVK